MFQKEEWEEVQRLLEEYLSSYEKAIKERNWKEVSRIEKELAHQGIGKMILSVLIMERRNSIQKND